MEQEATLRDQAMPRQILTLQRNSFDVEVIAVQIPSLLSGTLPSKWEPSWGCHAMVPPDSLSFSDDAAA